MGEENKEHDVVGYLYGELSGGETKALRRAADADPQLAEELRSLERTRAIYAEDSLPEPPDVLSEAILRQEKILRAEPESWWTPLLRIFWHPAFGATAVVAVAVGAGLFYSVGEVPDASAPRVAAPVPSPATPAVATGGAVDKAAMPADREPSPVWAPPAEQIKMAKAEDKRDDGLAGLVERPERKNKSKGMPPEAPGARYPTAQAQAMLDESEDDADLSAGEALAGKDAEVEGNALGRVASKTGSKGSGAPGSAGQLTDPFILSQRPSQDSFAGSAGNVAVPSKPATADSLVDEEAKPAPKPTRSSKAKRRPMPKKLQGRAGPASESQREMFEMQRMRAEDQALAHLRAGQAAYDTGRYREALDNYQMAQQLDTRRSLVPGSLIMEARAYRRLKQYRQAAEIFEQVLAHYPKHKARAKVLDELVVCYEALKQPALAQKARRRFAAQPSEAAAMQADSPAALDQVEAEAEPAAVAK